MKMTDDFVEKCRARQIGKKHSEERKNKISQSVKYTKAKNRKEIA